MNIVIYGAGAIGSLFGAYLAKNNTVFFIGRSPHIQCVEQKGLCIKGKTIVEKKIPGSESINNIPFTPDLVVLTVKAYDTEQAIKELRTIVSHNTIVLSVQNGLDNLSHITQQVDKQQVLAGVTTHGVVFSEPGVINHTGFGRTSIGEVSSKPTGKAQQIVDVFTAAGIPTSLNHDIHREIWSKAIVNSSINPLTTIIQCTNGYLHTNPILLELVKKVCYESTQVAIAEHITVTYDKMIQLTLQVIQETFENYSSMLQSIKKGQKTEIDHINGVIIKIGKKNNILTPLNEMLILCVKNQIYSK